MGNLFIPVTAQIKETLSAEQFISQVKQFHPVAKQAGLQVDKANAALLVARGNFDPVFDMNYDDKVFTGSNYYRYTNPEIKIPTISGVTIKSGIENTAGQNTSPEFSKGMAGYLGVELPLLKGLLIDRQRATLQQAKIFTSQSKQERANIINDLLYDAYVAYWQWTAAHQLYNIYANYLAVAQRRMNLVRVAFNNGDRSAGDTIEAFTQVQNFQLFQNDAAADLNTRYYELSVFLWNDKEQPYLLSDNYVPDLFSFGIERKLPELDSLERLLSDRHPLLSVYDAKRRILQVERKLKFQSLLPTVNLRANLLGKGYLENISLANSYLSNNYKIGISIKAPLFMRQARGEFKEAKIRITENNLLMDQKKWELLTKLKKYHRETALYEQQLKSATGIRTNYASLLRIEELKLGQGESSLFLINARENKMLEIDQKLIELRLKYLKSFYAIDWSAGVLR